MICKLNKVNINISGNKISSIVNGWSEYDVDVDRLFDVFALGVYNGKFKLLVDLLDNGKPFWYDISDFIFACSDIPDDWKSVAFDRGDWTMIFGYEILVASDSHFNGLLEREEQDLQIFRSIKDRYEAMRPDELRELW